MSDDTDQEPKKRSAKPLTEVGLIGRMEQSWLELSTDEARERVALYFAGRAGLDIRKFLANGDGMPK